MEKSLSERRMTATEELLSAVSKEELKPETRKSYTTHWSQVGIACCCILVLAAAGKGFLYLETKTSTVQSTVGSVVKELVTVKAQVTATDTRGQLATVTAELEDLKATNTQLRAEVQQLRETVDPLKGRKNNAGPAQPKRRWPSG